MLNWNAVAEADCEGAELITKTRFEAAVSNYVAPAEAAASNYVRTRLSTPKLLSNKVMAKSSA